MSSPEPTIWDNSNIVDNYPGLTLPLSTSFIRRTYEAGNRNLAGLLGLPPGVVDEHAHLFEHFVGSVHGRLYYNLTNIRGLLGLLPAAHLTRRYYDQAIGAPEEAHSRAPGDLVAGLRSVLTVAYHLLRLPWSRRHFARFLDQRLSITEGRDFDAMSPEGAALEFRRIQGEIMGRWRAPPLNGFVSMVLLATTRRLAARWGLDRGELDRMLTGGAESLSAQLIADVAALAADVRRDERLRALFAERSDAELLGAVESHRVFRSKVDHWLRTWGDRGVGGELKFENPTARERPELLFRAIRSHLDAPDPDSVPCPPSLGSLLPGQPVRRWVLASLVALTRTTLRWREDFRFYRARVFAQARRLLLALGRRLAEAGALEEGADVHWLTVDEVLAAAAGELVPEILRERIADRRARYAAWEHEALPGRIVFAGHPDDYDPSLAPLEPVPTSFAGQGCCPGMVRAPARVVHSPDDLRDLAGKVLVAVSADAGWTPFFPGLAGIVLERGGALSHVAIVTRELGIPCVMGARGITRAVADGDLVELDGATGEVRLAGRHMEGCQTGE